MKDKICEKKQLVFSVCGVKNSGKTTLIENLIREFTKEGKKVAVIKHDGHDFKADTENTDTHRAKVAGASGVLIFSKNKYMLIEDEKFENEKDYLKFFSNYDVVILEGLKNSEFPKIEIIRSEISKEISSNKKNLFCIVTDLDIKTDVPVVDLRDLESLMKIIKEEL
ncbi:molybdopterin-guanine dinucleotide biosynthesis protein B [Cetobacterium sp. 2A]|uniref:molybdopterin-guanine dinucleotide biosynthesis protein B n=1 Tax=unclassified Cetobacterium TaxID=2630983 RepID=UPI00163D3169|nr:molybdopterin-guanine dinucleotide biosynthesis protein B [Cetobacterium sp. 2A]MBC2855139.1 molybdopterin-guanine dinucleotide biosynthesis protein B [Cetobacterium sp. 2A]